MNAGHWTESAGIPTNRLTQGELQEMDAIIVKRSQATDLSEAEQRRYTILLAKARGEEPAVEPQP